MGNNVAKILGSVIESASKAAKKAKEASDSARSAKSDGTEETNDPLAGESTEDRMKKIIKTQDKVSTLFRG